MVERKGSYLGTSFPLFHCLLCTDPAVQTVAAPGHGGLPGPGEAEAGEAAGLQAGVQAEAPQQLLALQLELVRQRPERLPSPHPRVGVLVSQTRPQRLLDLSGALLQQQCGVRPSNR